MLTGFSNLSSWRLICTVLSALLLACLAGAALAAEADGSVAVTGATVVVGNGKTLSDATVLVRNGTIQKVGRNLSVPADAQVIDGKGLFVYPGLIDALREQPASGAGAAGETAAALYADSRVDTSKVDEAKDEEWTKYEVAPRTGFEPVTWSGR